MKKALSIYIHIPFCVRKCAYCDFLSAPATREVQEQYLHMLMREIHEKAARYAKEYVVKTIFIGGGTPTSVDADLLCQVLEKVKAQFEVSVDAEISMECNPGTADKIAFKKYCQAGVNRLSIGLQSTQNHLLQKLGRIHTFEQFLDTYQGAREAGFTNINIDLMSALPGQTLADYEQTLREVLALKPEHISAYSLIVEEGTPFYDMELNLLDEDTERMMYELTEKLLSEHGYHRYEISNYARKGMECKHNQVYWERGEYLGLGLGASSFLKLPWKDDAPSEKEVRLRNNSNLKTYLDSDFSYEEELVLTGREAMEEFFFLGLRQMKGVSLIQFAEEFGEDTIEWFYDAIGQNVRDGLLVQEGGMLFLTKKGIDVSNLVFERFLE
ncbi:MAG: oxygen-independent coproporphyrinogen III oxidase [Lachnospiraceae bacterium]|nr:oxygen-independent coproporphyrinogen III oxidase [Lachnospiraceae bacterium]